MDADERLTALKRAYADIILNTAKEAAARIMVSERKAVRFQHELSVTKEQALQMLLRLKQMMDSKVREAEMTYTSQQRMIEKLEGQVQNAEDTMSEAAVTSLSQQRKIEELEAQLHEAEDIVKDLREELREIQAELEKVRKKKLQHSGEHDTAPQSQTPQEEIGFHNSQSIVFHPPESQLESFATSDFKIAAFNQRNEAYNCHRPGDLRMGNASFSKPDHPSIVLRSKEPELYRNRRTQRIRAFEEKLMAGELSFSDTVDDAIYEASGEAEEAEGICKTPTYNNIQTTEKKSVVQADFSWHQVQKISVSRRKRRRATIYKNSKMPAQSGRDPSKKVLMLSTGTTENGILLKCTEVTESDTELVKSVRVENSVNKDQTSTDELLLTELVGGSVENLGVPILRMDVEKMDVPVMNSETKTYSISDGFPNRPVIDRVIKYTFQRKRKKESLSSPDENAKAEESVLKKRTAENGPEQVEKSSLITESSRDSRRLAQVARQLISLSEKKWWH